MAPIDASSPFSVVSLVEDVLQQHGPRSRHLDLDARRAEEAGMRRCEAAAWLRKVVGVVSAKDLPAEPSEEEFRLGLRSGIILCNALNKIQPGAVQKVVEGSCDSMPIPDRAALSAFQYFENIRNFLVAVEEMGMPTFEASDLEQGGKSSRVVNCVLALKSYNEWKQTGGNGTWKFGGNVKTSCGKQFSRKNTEPFTGSLPRGVSTEADAITTMSSSSLSMLVRAMLLDKKPEEVPNLVESVLSKVVEEFEQRITTQIETKKASFRDSNLSFGSKCMLKSPPNNAKIEEKSVAIPKRDEKFHKYTVHDKESESALIKQQSVVDQQKKDVKVLKQTISNIKSGMQFMQMKFQEEIQNFGLHIQGLSYAASGYHKVLDENRKLYNQIQDLKGNIRVYCRVRPFLPGQYDYLSTVDNIEEGAITINTLGKNGKGRKSFSFNKVFGPSATQDEVFSDTQPLIRSVLDGYNVCIFAYGQTGSGKTYTMTGPKDLTEQSQGVNYRALHDLFLLAEQRQDTFRYDVSVQMIEIYNEQVRDLLNTDGVTKRLEIRNSSQTGLSVPDASLVRVSSTSDIIDLMSLGQRNRVVSATALNDRSSRSHSCLTVHVQGRDLISGEILRGCMHLVDLAGSERVDKSEVKGDRLKEAQHINKSLSALGDVISSLANKSSHVPYRNSKLTQLLQDSLGGQAKTLMFVHISPEPDAVGETISTLKFAERVGTVELGAARVNKDPSDVKELKEQITSLKASLTRKDGQQKMPQPQQQSPSPLQSVGSRKPKQDSAGDTEVHRKSKLRPKRQSLDIDELLGQSPTWPPNREEDREMSSGEWVDKLMVNKQDPLSCWEPNNGNVHGDEIYQKYLSDSSKYYSDLLHVNNTSDEMDEIDGATSGSSEPDLLWQFNHSKLGSFSSNSNNNSIGPPVMHKQQSNRSSSATTMIPRLSPSLSRKAGNEGAHPPPRAGRHSAERKGKTGTRK